LGRLGVLRSADVEDRNRNALLGCGGRPSDAEVRAAAYDGPELLAAETEHAGKRAERIAAYRARLVDGPVLVLPFRNMRISFDPLGLESLDEIGTVYPTLQVTDDWGILEVTAGGAFVDAGWTRAQVPALFEREGAELRGEGWSLRLAPGWSVEAGEREGDVRLVAPGGTRQARDGRGNSSAAGARLWRAPGRRAP
jgi:hypothetical protein